MSEQSLTSSINFLKALVDMSNTTVQAIEANIAEARKIVDFGHALERLQNNADFKKVVKEGYFKDEAIRLVHAKSNPNLQSADSQRFIIQQMDAIGSLTQYFDMVFHKASLAAKAIDADEEARDEILAEGAE